MSIKNAYRLWIPQWPPPDFSVEEVALFGARRGILTKWRLIFYVTSILAGGSRRMRRAEHIRWQPEAIKAVLRLINTGVLVRDQKWPYHIKLGV